MKRSTVAFLSLIVLILVLVVLGSRPAWGLRPRETRARFDERVVRLQGGVVGVAPIAHDRLPWGDPLHKAWDPFVTGRGAPWRVWLDPRSGLPTLATGAGIRWLPVGSAPAGGDGATTLRELEKLARAFLDHNEALLGDWSDQLVLDRNASLQLGPDIWQVTFRQVVGGVPVEGARFDFHVASGNLVAFGAASWAPVRCTTTAKLTAEEAWGGLLAWLGVTSAAEVVQLRPAELTLVPVDPARGAAARWSGVRGEGYDHLLVWRLTLRVPGEPAQWVALVDAATGAVASFTDATRYDRAQGGVYPQSSDGVCPSGCERAGLPMPFADVSVDGAASFAAGTQGLYTCPGGGIAATTTLSGPYARVQDHCGAIAEHAACGTTLELGAPAGIDCEVAPGSSPGNTHASRTSFYHLNRMAEKARMWLPANTWATSQVPDVVDIDDICNAFWDDVPGSVNFYKSGAGCGNTAEVAGTVRHEWGHGLDFNDGGGYDDTSESYADVVAFLESRESCGARGFFQGTNCAGYGDACLDCTGVREHDWAKHESHTPHTPLWAIAECNLGDGPCSMEQHCESAVSTEAVWDLATRDLPAMGLGAASAWQITDKLFYLSRPGSGGNVYNCSAGMSDGCGAISWFHKFLLVDDDDGNLANGTPHAAAIYAAFDRHAIACGEATDASNQSHSSCPALAKPALSAVAQSSGVALSWAPVANAASYRVYRNDLGCDRAQIPVAGVLAPAAAYTDSGLAVESPVYYRVQAIGSNAACESPVSDCLLAYPVLPAGTVLFTDAVYGCASTIHLRVNDGNVGASTLTVQVSSTTETLAETVALTETRTGSAVYEGSILATADAPTHADSRISLTHGDTLAVQYVDASDGASGTNVPRTAQASVDCVAPANMNVRVTDRFTIWATVRWEVTEPATGAVIWGAVRPPGTTALAPETGRSHAVKLTGLSPCTTYWFAVRSTDAAGNVGIAADGGGDYHFETFGSFPGGVRACHQAEMGALSDAYTCNDFLMVSVQDSDLNVDPNVADTAEAWVSSTRETAPERVVLTESMASSGYFVGSIQIRSGAPASDGVLQVANGDVITATYFDANDGTGAPAVVYRTAPADCSGPLAHDVAIRSLDDAGAVIHFETDEPVQTGYIKWGTTPMSLWNLAVVSAAGEGYDGVINTLTSSCQSIYFQLSLTDARSQTAITDAGGIPFGFDTQTIPGLYWKDGLETGGAGWTLQGEWQVYMFGGLGAADGGLPDPVHPYHHGSMLGQDLSGMGAHMGAYEPGTTQSALSPVLNASSWTHTKLIFYRSLQSAAGDDASVTVRVNGTPHVLYDSALAAVSDPAWTRVGYDLSAFADGAAQVQLELKQTADATTSWAGFTVDDVIVKDGSNSDYASCGGCTGKPSFAGVKSVAACGPNGVTLSWDPAVAWGSASGGTYAVYRGTTSGFPADASHRVAHGVSSIAWVDTGAPLGVVFYLVKAESGETCSTGPHNGGVLDDNAVYATATQQAVVPQPQPVDGMTASVLSDAHVRLVWPASPNATLYRIYRSPDPVPVNFVLIGETGALFYVDEGSAANLETYDYVVRAANACGAEAP